MGVLVFLHERHRGLYKDTDEKCRRSQTPL
jgi:hypothetical protein